jgi:cathepsin B|eukprot:5847913-Prymnesium_polylepis.1
MAAAQVFADRVCIGGDAEYAGASVEYMLDCDVRDDACGGGLLDDAWRFLRDTGVPSTTCDPYVAANGSARAVCPALCSDGKPMRRMTASSAYAVATPGKPSSGSVALC